MPARAHASVVLDFPAPLFPTTRTPTPSCLRPRRREAAGASSAWPTNGASSATASPTRARCSAWGDPVEAGSAGGVVHVQDVDARHERGPEAVVVEPDDRTFGSVVVRAPRGVAGICTPVVKVSNTSTVRSTSSPLVSVRLACSSAGSRRGSSVGPAKGRRIRAPATTRSCSRMRLLGRPLARTRRAQRRRKDLSVVRVRDPCSKSSPSGIPWRGWAWLRCRRERRRGSG